MTKHTTAAQIVKAKTLADQAFLIICLQCWGNRRQGELAREGGDLEVVEELAPDENGQLVTVQKIGKKKSLRLSKTLIEHCEELDEIEYYMAKTKEECEALCNPSFVFEGCFACDKNKTLTVDGVERRVVEIIDSKLEAAQKHIREVLIPKFLKVYPAQIEKSKHRLNAEAKRLGLKPQFNANDYPKPEHFNMKYSIVWNWMEFSVPKGLPEGMIKKEQAKFEQNMKEAGEEIVNSLRLSFQALIDHAVDRLAVKPGEKPKVFKDATIDNINAFIDTFAARDIFNDAQLAALVAKAREISKGCKPSVLRESSKVRETTAKKFEAIKKDLDGMMEVKKTRKITLE